MQGNCYLVDVLPWAIHVLSLSFAFPFCISSWHNGLGRAQWPETRAAPASHKAWQGDGRQGTYKAAPLLSWSWTNRALFWQDERHLRASSAGGFREEYRDWGEGLGRARTTLTSQVVVIRQEWSHSLAVKCGVQPM